MLAQAISWSMPSVLRTRGRRMVSVYDMDRIPPDPVQQARALRAVQQGSTTDAVGSGDLRA
jgi:hypothetical protein